MESILVVDDEALVSAGAQSTSAAAVPRQDKGDQDMVHAFKTLGPRGPGRPVPSQGLTDRHVGG